MSECPCKTCSERLTIIHCEENCERIKKWKGEAKKQMSKFKVGDLVVPSAEAKEKGIKFNKNAVFPWEVMKVRSPTVWLQQFSKIANARTERWHEDFFELWKGEANNK